MLFILLFSFAEVCLSDRCDSAPDDGRREICRQISMWDRNSRKSLAAISTRMPTVTYGLASQSAAAPAIYDCMDMNCLCTYLGGTGPDPCLLANGQRIGKALRKEYRTMTDDERSRYTNAFWSIKWNGDFLPLSAIHTSFELSPGAHSGPAFLPWHREYLKRLEFALRKVNPSVSFPYWDSVLDSSLPDPRDSVLWSDELMGYPGKGDLFIRSGSFANWTIDDGSRVFRRHQGEKGSLYKEDDITRAMAINDISQVLAFTAAHNGCATPASWDVIEYTHGGPHVYVGGDMLVTTTSTWDPIFFQHHAFVDFIWEKWRQLKQTRTVRETAYPADSPACSSSAHYGSSPMSPFQGKINTDGLSNKYLDNLVDYAPRPSCTAENISGCNSRFLFCDISHGTPRCASKIRLGGNCTGYTNNEDCCYGGSCKNNVCVAATTTTTTQLLTTTTTTTTTSPVPPTTTTSRTTTTTSTTPLPTTRATITTTPPQLTTTSPPPMTTTTPQPTTTTSTTPPTPPPPKTTSPSTTTTTPTTTTLLQLTTTTPTTTTTTTSPTTTTALPAVESCFNGHYCCSVWSSHDQCAINPSYMRRYCGASCNICTPTTYDVNSNVCSDRSVQCASRLSTDGCGTDWMIENCRSSCQLCSITRIQQCTAPRTAATSTTTTTTTTPSPSTTNTTSTTIPTTSSTEPITTPTSTTTTTTTSSTTTTTTTPTTTTSIAATTPTVPNTTLCLNSHFCCEAWDYGGFCGNPSYNQYMTSYCPLSCERCPTNTIPPADWKGDVCRDYLPSCAASAAAGECSTNLVYMKENCKVSCGQCSLLNFPSLLAACGVRSNIEPAARRQKLHRNEGNFRKLIKNVKKTKILPPVLTKMKWKQGRDNLMERKWWECVGFM